MTIMNTTFQGEQRPMNRGLRFSRKQNVFAGRRAHALRSVRHIARIVLRASLAVLAIAAVLALQGALYVYLWRLPV